MKKSLKSKMLNYFGISNRSKFRNRKKFKTNNLLKSLLKPFLLEMSFVVLSFFALVYARNRLAYYISQISEHAGRLAELQSQVAAGSISAEQVINYLEPLKNIIFHAQILIYFILPSALFVLFVVFDGLANSYLMGVKRNKAGYLVKFALFFLPLYVLLVWIVAKMTASFADFFVYGSADISLIAAFFAYSIFIFYVYASASSFMDLSASRMLKKIFMVSLPSLAKVLLLAIAMAFAGMFVLAPFAWIYVKYISSHFSFSMIYLFLFMAAATFFCTFYKKFMIFRIRKILGNP